MILDHPDCYFNQNLKTDWKLVIDKYVVSDI